MRKIVPEIIFDIIYRIKEFYRRHDLLMYYVPSKYPPELLYGYRMEYLGANISNPKKLLKKLSMITHLLALSLAILTFLILVPSSLNIVFHKLQLQGLQIPLKLHTDLRFALAVSAIAYLSIPPMMGFFLTTYLKTKLSMRREKIDRNVYPLIVAMYGFAKARLTIFEIVREVCLMGLEGVSEEFEKINNAIVYGGMGVKAALLNVATTTPSRDLADLLKGLVGLLESGGDLVRYLEDRLLITNVTRRTWLSSYLERLRLFGESYMAASTMLSILALAIGLAQMTMGAGSLEQIYFTTYFILPAISAGLLLVLHLSSPEKEQKRAMSKISDAAIVLIVALLIASSLSTLLNFGYENYLLAFSVLVSLTVALPIERVLRHERSVERALPIFFNRLIALMESGKDISTAVNLAARDEPGPLGKYVKVLSTMLLQGIPRNKAFMWLSRNSPIPEMGLMNFVLSKTAAVSGKFVDVLLSLLDEMHRLNEYKKQRVSVARTISAVLILSLIVYAGISVVLSSEILEKLSGRMSNVKHIEGQTISTGISEYQIGEIKKAIKNTLSILAITTSLGIVAIDGDRRKFCRVYSFLALIVLVVNLLFLA